VIPTDGNVVAMACAIFDPVGNTIDDSRTCILHTHSIDGGHTGGNPHNDLPVGRGDGTEVGAVVRQSTTSSPDTGLVECTINYTDYSNPDNDHSCEWTGKASLKKFDQLGVYVTNSGTSGVDNGAIYVTVIFGST